jgi:hypothetical protein
VNRPRTLHGRDLGINDSPVNGVCRAPGAVFFHPLDHLVPLLYGEMFIHRLPIQLVASDLLLVSRAGPSRITLSPCHACRIKLKAFISHCLSFHESLQIALRYNHSSGILTSISLNLLSEFTIARVSFRPSMISLHD